MNQLLFILLLALPRIDITYDTLATDTFYPGTFRFTNLGDTIMLDMTIRHRGASSLQYDKPSYAVKLYDSLGISVDTSFLNMRRDNYWILDAMASDKARMRNRVSMDLWLEFSRKPWYYDNEPELINGYRGQMVEVYVNDMPYGIYHFMERVDRKQLKLKKYSQKNGIRGVLYKDVQYSLLSNYYIDYRNPMPTTTTDQWDGFEQKYPDIEDGEPMSWTQLYHHVETCRKTPSLHYADSVETHLDVPVYVDYILFTYFLSARDNVRKNTYLSCYTNTDERVLYTPWDIDHSWGRMYNSLPEEVDSKLDWNLQFLYKRMISDYHLEDTLRARYAKLRQHYFTIEHIDSLFAPYFALYAATGADTLEQRIWSGHNKIEFDIPSEQAYIHDWVIEHLQYLDDLFQYAPPEPPLPTFVDKTQYTTCPATLVWRNHQIVIQKGDVCYDIYGRQISAPPSMTSPR